MELKDTVELMLSDKHEDRFKAEYYQTKTRYNRLYRMVIKYEAGTLDFEPICSMSILVNQKRAMGEYLHYLEVRAEMEGIEL